MSNIIVIQRFAESTKARRVGALVAPICDSELGPRELVDCTEGAMDALALSVRLLRLYDEQVCDGSLSTAKQLACIETRLAELRLQLTSVRRRMS